MSEWEYKIVRLDESEHGIFVCRHTEWRLLLKLRNVAVSYDSYVGGLQPASDIAQALGWERGADVGLPGEPSERASQERWLRNADLDPEKYLVPCDVQTPPLMSPEDGRRALQKEQEATILRVAAKRAKAGEPVIPSKTAKRKSPVMATVWTEQAVSLLKKHRTDEGLSYETIAKTMTAELRTLFTSSMCSAKADRLGIPKIPLLGGRPPKAKSPKPAQDAKADKDKQNDGGPRTEEAIVPVASPADAGADPAAGTTIGNEGPQGIPLLSPFLSVEDAVQRGLANAASSKKVSVYPDVTRDSVGHFPHKPTLLEAVEWYRDQGNRVFIANGQVEVFDGPGDKREIITHNQFLAKVNNLRVRQSLDPFEIAA